MLFGPKIMKWSLTQIIKNGIELPKGKEIKFENCTIATDNTCRSSPSGYSESFYGLTCHIFQGENLIFQLFNPQFVLMWKGVLISGISEVFENGKTKQINQKFWAVCSQKNEEEK